MESMKTSRSVVVLNGKGSLDCLANGHIIQGTAKVVDALLKQPSFLRVWNDKWPSLLCHRDRLLLFVFMKKADLETHYLYLWKKQT